MSETAIIITGIIIFIILNNCYSRHLRIKRAESIIYRNFGKKPPQSDYEFKEIKLWQQELGVTEGPHVIDDITWNDLDMDDVFARINSCCSFAGEQYLYKRLRNPWMNEQLCHAQENRINYLNEREDERRKLQMNLMRLGKRGSSYYIPSFLNNLTVFTVKNSFIYKGLLISLIVLALFSLLTQNIICVCLLGVNFMLNLCLYGLMKNKYETNIEVINSIRDVLVVVKHITNSNELHYEEEFHDFSREYKKLKGLVKLLKFISGRYQNQITADFMGICASYIAGAFLLDFIVYNKAIKEIEKNKKELCHIIEKIGELDTNISIESFRRSILVWCRPKVIEEKRIKYQRIYNPLLDTPVYNDICLDKGCVITGSNASGKSTFIKAVAVNGILAQSINTCAAEYAEVPYGEIYTSMAVKDSLLEGESYFVREIKSLRRIIDTAKNGSLVTAVIDEILRGTNTDERLAASAAILNYIKEKNCIAIVASHDIELMDMLEGGDFDFYYFCESSKENEIIFDYRIHPGIGRQTNAIRLLEVTDFPVRIVEEAKRTYESRKQKKIQFI